MKYPTAYHKGYMHRENGMQNAQPYSISSECADYHWYAAGWNDADMAIKRKQKYAEAVNLMEQGVSAQSVCKNLSINYGSFRSHISRKKIKVNTSKKQSIKTVHKEGKLLGIYTPEDVQNMANDLKSWKLVSRAVGVPYCAIRTWASDNGVYIRKKKAN